MRGAALLAVLALAAVLAPFRPAVAVADGDTLDRIRAQGVVACGLRGGVGGMSFVDQRGHLDGFMVDFCRALAAAVLGDAQAIRLVRLPDKPQEFEAVAERTVDISFTTTTWTFSRDVLYDIEFLTPLLFDGQGFAVWSGGERPPPLDRLGAQTVCVKSHTTTLMNLEDRIAQTGQPWTIRTFRNFEEALQSFLSRECGMLTTDRSVLVTSLADYRRAGLDIHIYPDVISREPLTPYVARGDRNWYDIVRWTLYAMIMADSANVTSQSVRAGNPPESPELARLLSGLGEVPRALTLPPDWALQVIAQVGNYSEVFERHLGDGSRYAMEPGPNQPWNRGGLLFPPSFQ